MTIPVDWTVAGPATVVMVGALVALIVDAFYHRRTWLGSGLPATVAVLAGIAELVRGNAVGAPFAFSVVVLLGTLFVVVASNVMNFENAMPPGEYHFLLMSAAAGALLMVSARDVVTLVVALELLSLPSIALVGLRQGDAAAIRAAWTFFLASVVSTAITLMGVSLLYGVAETLEYAGLREALVDPDVPESVVSVAVVLTVVGLLFKLGAVPFHAWVPDAYGGASVMVAGFLSAVSKAGALGALLVLLAQALPEAKEAWAPVVAIVAAVTMTIGNVGALRQDDAVGLLAWSSIAQAGFMLAPAVAITGPYGLTPAVQYVAVYALANLVAFAALAVVLRLRGSTRLSDLRGMARNDPWMGIPLVLAALTLAGFPPAVIGLVTKFVVIRPVVLDDHVWLAVVMGVNVMLGLAYYLRVVVTLCGRADGDPYVSPSPPISVRFAKSTVLIGSATLVVLSAWPDLLLSHLP